jgi:hypothetical protein
MVSTRLNWNLAAVQPAGGALPDHADIRDRADVLLPLMQVMCSLTACI